MRNNMKLAISVLLLGLSSITSYAAVSDKQFQQLLQQVQLMSERLDNLEKDNARLQQTNTELTLENQKLQTAKAEGMEVAVEMETKLEHIEKRADAASWAERIRWQGDFRPRYEFINPEGDQSRNRMRIRARANLVADVTPNTEVGIGIVSGSENPTSSNQSLGSVGTTKELKLDLAYFDWSATPNLNIGGGKFRNPILRVGGHSILWDSDWRPEGANLRWQNQRLFVNSLGTWLEGDSRRGTSFSYMLQGGVLLEPADNIKLKLGAGYYVFDTKGRSSFFGDGDLFGNSASFIPGVYRYNYNVLDTFAELNFKLFGLPAIVFAEYLRNSEAPTDNTGYSLGFRLGKVSKKGSWDLRYAYQSLEKDATFGLIADSDFGGGGADVRGHVFRANYGIDKNWSAGIIYINSQNNFSSGDPRDFERLQLDILFRFK